ncbi:hypothetical protein BpHYR1_045083 [Brachionus plicatilis]|uniref:Uncharacterized protein n=1 Tax=Brachionus plicatilis TaxID=10195 RepID=A0A3M7PPQ0_BRAPC|nr:hypothetical protein BpHYR1_045083 [Brachionus plicatilis]
MRSKGMFNSKNQILKDISYLKHFSEKIKSKSIKVADLDKKYICDFDPMSSEMNPLAIKSAKRSQLEQFKGSTFKRCFYDKIGGLKFGPRSWPAKSLTAGQMYGQF